MFQFSLAGLSPLKSDPFPFTDLQKNWLAALRSGKYKQGTGFLRDKNDGYCCLGVLCDVAGWQSELKAEKAYTFREPDSTVSFFSTGYLPAPLRIAAQLLGDLGQFCSPVRFPNVDYKDMGSDFSIGKPAHKSLGSMNDNRILPDGKGDMRPFNFEEIAAYIEFDPWNVFLPPVTPIAECAPNISS